MKAKRRMRHYYINRGSFGNIYRIRWVYVGSEEEKALVEQGFERLTKKQAIQKCYAARAWHRNGEYCQADDYIYPPFAPLFGDDVPVTNDGYTVEKYRSSI